MTRVSCQPWYPASWLDADGKPLPDVHEVTPGEWPPCRPGDVIEVLYHWERSENSWAKRLVMAEHEEWAHHYAVAIRIIKRAKP